MIRILVVEDHYVARYGLRGLLAEEDDLEVVGEAKDGAEAVAQHQALRPDVVLMDLRLPVLDGFQAITAIRLNDPKARVLVLSSFDSEEEVAEAMAVGATGFVMKEEEGDKLVDAIRLAAKGEQYLSPTLAQRLEERNGRDTGLNARDRRMLQLFAKGLTTNEIGEVLGFTPGTVRVYASQIYAKLNVSTRSEAVAVALERGILRPK
jgi:DNA-binding NarL/FixJ family response regulator